MVDGMARSENCADSGSFDGEDLAICDGILAEIGSVLVNSVCPVGVVGYKIRNATGMVSVPMSQKDE